jgi:hypothetical protein
MRELRFNGTVKLVKVGTHDMVADMLTKPLSDADFQRHRNSIMNLPSETKAVGLVGRLKRNGDEAKVKSRLVLQGEQDSSES